MLCVMTFIPIRPPTVLNIIPKHYNMIPDDLVIIKSQTFYVIGPNFQKNGKFPKKIKKFRKMPNFPKREFVKIKTK